MRRIFLAAAGCALAIVLSGCGDDEFIDDDEAAGQFGTEPWSSGPVAAGGSPAAASIPECMAFENAPPSSEDALVGSWGYINAMLFYPNDEPIWAEAVGTLVLGADGRYDIERQMENTGLKYGPGDWSFDGSSLTLTPDDGTDPETYNHVIATDMALTLVNSDDSGCMVYFLGPSA